ncbi:MAG: hypothetical protein FK732_06950 [Asgard group archaeon]|nr:hypothetical protein [Asgard group archaeon]
MKISKSFGILLVILFSSQIFLVVSSGNMNYTNFSANQTESSSPFEEITFISEAGPGFENVKGNIMRDGGFEEINAYGGPEHYWYGGSGYQFSNASYKDDVHGGLYGLYYGAKGTDQFYTEARTSRYLPYIPERAYLIQDISLDVWIKPKANPDISTDAIAQAYLELRVNSGSGTYRLYYCFSKQDFSFSNDTDEAYFDVREPIGSWFNLQRNVTLDLEVGIPTATIDSSFYVENIYFTAVSPRNPTGFVEVLVDDVVISNVSAFNYLEINGDFEDGNGGWWSSNNYGPSSTKLSYDDYTQGLSSLNLTASAYFDDGSSSYQNVYKNLATGSFNPDTYYPLAPGDFVINFDWKYSDTENGGNNQDAYYYISLENDTMYAYLYFMLGEDSDSVTSGNITDPSYFQRYYLAPSFGSRNTWEHFSLDLFEILQIENLQNIVPYYNGWGIDAGEEQNCTVTLLVDDYNIITDPLGDPSFEQAEDWLPNDPLNSWSSQSHDYVNRTTDAHSGTYACNATSYGGIGNTYCYRYSYFQIEANLYTDFWWRLDTLSGPNPGYSYIYLTLDNSYYMYYILGVTPSSSLINSSNTVFYYVANQNQTGIWNNLFRNVQYDAFEAFGDANWNITEIRMGNYAVGTTTVSTIFDDLYFVRDIAGPVITGLAQSPPEPQYGEAVTIEVDVTDNVDVFAVEMFYKIGAGSWIGVPMTNTVDIHYEAVIPAQDYNTVIQYYFIAYDIYGFDTPLGSALAPFEYTVADFIDPILDVERPLTTEPIIGDVIFNITGEDPGSGIALFEISIGTETVYSDAIVPADYLWHTTYLDNGNQTIVFSLEDNAGNIAVLELEYNIDNLIPWYVRAKTFLKKWYPYISAGAGVLIVGSFTLAIVIRVRRRRKAA